MPSVAVLPCFTSCDRLEHHLGRGPVGRAHLVVGAPFGRPPVLFERLVIELLRGGAEREFYALYVLPEAQGCGIGTTLIAHAARCLVRQRWLGAAVWVLEDNTLGRRFYERLDGRPLGIAKTLAYRGTDYPKIREMAIGRPDLRRASWLVDEPNRR